MYNKQLKKNTKMLSFWIHLEAIDLTNRKLTNPKNVKKSVGCQNTRWRHTGILF
jgi:hypothetical protein